MSGSLSKRSDVANDNSCLGPAGLSLALRGPPEALPPPEEPPSTKWLKDGQNLQRRAAERDQNRNEVRPPPEQSELSARNARNAAAGGAPLIEDEEEEEEEEEGPAEEHPTKGSTDSGTKQADPHVRSQPGTHPGRGFSLGPPNGTAPRRFGWGGHTHTRRLHSPQQFEEARLRGRT